MFQMLRKIVQCNIFAVNYPKKRKNTKRKRMSRCPSSFLRFFLKTIYLKYLTT